MCELRVPSATNRAKVRVLFFVRHSFLSWLTTRDCDGSALSPHSYACLGGTFCRNRWGAHTKAGDSEMRKAARRRPFHCDCHVLRSEANAGTTDDQVEIPGGHVRAKL